MIDSGLTAREIKNRLNMCNFSPKQINGVILTHAHKDHYRSVGTLSKKFDIKIYTEEETYNTILTKDNKNMLSKIETVYETPYRIGDIEIVMFSLSHGSTIPAGKPIGLLFINNEKKIGYITDLGYVTDEIKEILKGCNKIFIEANYDEKIIKRKLSDKKYNSQWWYLKWVMSNMGHLSNEQCADALSDMVTEKTEEIFLAHISQNHQDPDMDNNNFDLASDHVKYILKKNGKHVPKIYKTYRKGRDKTWNPVKGSF